MPNRLRSGKASELQVFGRLMAAGIDVYSTVADDQGIDAVARVVDLAGRPHYFDIQVKSASSWYGFRRVFSDELKNRENLIFVFFNTSKNELLWMKASELGTVTPVWAKSQSRWGPVQLTTEAREGALAGRDAEALRVELEKMVMAPPPRKRGGHTVTTGPASA